MGTFRDDLVRFGQRLVETVEDRTGREVVERERLELLESAQSELRVAEKTLEFIGWNLMNHQGTEPGSPMATEMLPTARKFAAQQSLVAWVDDPMAGQAVDLYLSFVIGRGVPWPQAPDPEVQAHLDETWEDESNKQILTTADKLAEKGIDLCLQSNLYFPFFDEGDDGMARASLLRFRDVEDVVRHPLNDWRILWFKCTERVTRYDFKSGSYELAPTAATRPDEAPKTVYYEAVGGFNDDDPVFAEQDRRAKEMGLPLRPPEDQVRPGKVLHVAVNKTSEMAFGVPRMRRLLRWYAEYNETIVSHTKRMKAMASVYMQAKVQGGQRDIDRLGEMALGRRSAFGPSREADPERPPAAPAPMGPGILAGNQSLSYEPFKIDSGATDLQASAPIMRAQLTGPWPDGFLSGNADGALSSQQMLELPTLKFVRREQDVIVRPFKHLGEASIDAAVRAGFISEWREPSVSEMRQIATAERLGEPIPYELNEDGMIRRDLSFKVAMPDPLERMLTDLVAAAVQTATAVDPAGENEEMSRWLFGHILAEGFNVEDPMSIVDRVLPRNAEDDPGQTEQERAMREDPELLTGAIGPDGERHPQGNPGGAPQQAPDAEDRVQEAAMDWTLLDEPASEVLRRLEQMGSVPALNGNGKAV